MQNFKILGIPTTKGELIKLIESFPDDTSFGFRNMPLLELVETTDDDVTYISFQYPKDEVMSYTQEQYDEAMQSMIDWEKEIDDHNNEILKDFNQDDLKELFIDIRITDKIQWVDKPTFKPEYNPDKYGIFTQEFVNQWSIGDSGDSYEGFLYLKVKGHKQYLKVRYSC